MSERPTPEQIEELRADVADGRWGFVERDHPQIEDATGRLWYGTSDDAAGLRYGAWIDLSASRMAHLVRRAGYAESLLAEVDALTKQAEEREADMHSRVRAGYDATIADCWRAKVAEVEAREAAAIARAVAAEQRAETVELALAELRRRAWLHLEYAGGYTDHVSRDGLRAALRDEPTDLAEALRRELLADGMDKAATELVEYYRVRAHRSGRVDEAQLFADLSDDITTTAADLRNGKPEANR